MEMLFEISKIRQMKKKHVIVITLSLNDLVTLGGVTSAGTETTGPALKP